MCKKIAQKPASALPNVRETWRAKNRFNTGPDSPLRPKCCFGLSPSFPELGEHLTKFVETW
jgi:hypothetical protein